MAASTTETTMASKFITIGDTTLVKAAITQLTRKPAVEIREVSFETAKQYPYSLCIGIGEYKIINNYASEKDRDRDFDTIIRAIEDIGNP
jgi:hypothetical protein